MDNSGQITEANKNYVYSLLADIVYRSLEDAALTPEEGCESADLILNSIESISTYEQLMAFLTNLSERWSVFRKAITIIKEEGLKIIDQQKIMQVRQQLHTYVQN